MGQIDKNMQALIASGIPFQLGVTCSAAAWTANWINEQSQCTAEKFPDVFLWSLVAGCIAHMQFYCMTHIMCRNSLNVNVLKKIPIPLRKKHFDLTWKITLSSSNSNVKLYLCNEYLLVINTRKIRQSKWI